MVLAVSHNEPTTRERILDAALDLFSVHGYDGASIRQIARAVGLRESSLYNHFAGKEAILHALIDRHGPASSARRLQGARYSAVRRDPAGFCRLYAADLVTQWLDPAERKFQKLLWSGAERLKYERAHFQETLFVDEQTLAVRFFRGFALAGLIAVPDAREAARLFMGGITFIRLEQVMFPAVPAPRDQVERAVERFLDGFLTLIGARTVEPAATKQGEGDDDEDAAGRS